MNEFPFINELFFNSDLIKFANLSIAWKLKKVFECIERR